MSIFEVLSMLLLVIGTEVYGRDAEAAMEPISNYSPSFSEFKQFNYDVEIIPRSHSNSNISKVPGTIGKAFR